MRTVTFVNQKGGCSKTSSVFHLSYNLAASGLRVLLVDNDPQGSLTQGFWGPSRMESLHPSATIAAAYAGHEPVGLAAETGIPGVWIVPGSPFTAESNLPPPRDRWDERQWALQGLVESVRDDFDVCLVDNPPNLHLCGWASLLAADALVVPLQPEDFGSQGLNPVRESFEAAGPANPGLALAGYLLTMVDRRLSVHAAYERHLRERYGPLVFAATVPRAADFVESVAARKPVGLYRPRGTAARAMRAVADELATRCGLAPAGQGVAA